jgi:catechol 2,3-dioxygenase-like lactoylglutathione lyase family enzyme
MDDDEVSELLRSQVGGTPIFGVKLWREWREDGFDEPAGLEEVVTLIRCATRAEAAEKALALYRGKDTEWVNERGNTTRIVTLGVDDVFEPYESRAASGLELYAALHRVDDNIRPWFGPPPWLWRPGPPAPAVSHLHLRVADVARSQAFYEEFFDLFEDVWHGDVLFLGDGTGFQLALAPGEVEPMPSWWHFGFRLPLADDVRALQRRFAAAGHEPLEAGDEEALVWFRVRDPDGYAVEVYWE